jgi:hypothetical protein
MFSVESIEGCKKRAGPLSLVSHWTRILLEDCVYQPQSRRQLCLACAIILPVRISSVTHILHNHVHIKFRRLSVARRWASMWAAKCLFDVSNGDLKLNPVNGGRQHLRLVRIKYQILVKQTDEPGVVQMIHWLEEWH